jgi:hypothetical protein
MVVVSGTSSGGGGGGGGCARRLGSVDMVVSGCQIRRSVKYVCYRRRVLHVKVETAALRLAQAQAPHHLTPQALADGPAQPFILSFKIPCSREVPENCIPMIEKYD